jgi:hypothetical protein
MAHATTAAPTIQVPALPIAQLAPWALFFGVIATLTIFFVSTGQGAVGLPAGTLLHEWVHDARHLLGYPCH